MSYKVKATGNTFKITPDQANALNLHVNLLTSEGHEIDSTKDFVLALYQDSQNYYAQDLLPENKQLKAKIEHLEKQLLNEQGKTSLSVNQEINSLKQTITELEEVIEEQENRLTFDPETEIYLNNYIQAFQSCDLDASPDDAIIDLLDTIKKVHNQLKGYGVNITIKGKKIPHFSKV